jgi:hypothetical protein
MDSFTNVGHTTTESHRGTIQVEDGSRESRSYANEFRCRSPDSTISERSRCSEDSDECVVRNYVWRWIDMSEINMGTIILQVYQSTGRTSDEYLNDSDMFFSDPVDLCISDTGSFNADDMYGVDYSMEPVSDSSHDSSDEDMQISQSPVDGLVHHPTFPVFCQI